MNQNDSSVDFEVPYVFVMIHQRIFRYPMFFWGGKNLPCLVDWDQPMKPCRRGGFSRDGCYGSHRWNSRWNGCWPVQLQLMSESTSNNKAGKNAIMMYWHAEVGNVQQLNSLTAWCFLYLDLRFVRLGVFVHLKLPLSHGTFKHLDLVLEKFIMDAQRRDPNYPSKSLDLNSGDANGKV